MSSGSTRHAASSLYCLLSSSYWAFVSAKCAGKLTWL